MRGWVIGLLAAAVFALVPGCSGKCKNPQRITDAEGREGPAYQCNVKVTCAGHQGPDKPKTLTALEDPLIADRGYDSYNESACKRLAATKNACGTIVKIEVSPALICLDAAGGPDGSGPDVSVPSGGTLVTVGVGAGSGDYPLDDDGEEEGMGGAGGAGTGAGAGGQGGI